MKLNTRSLAAAFCLALTSLAATNAQAQLNMYFTNEHSGYADSNIWITIQRGQSPSLDVSASNVPDITYGTNQFQWQIYTNTVGSNTQVGSLFSDSVRLSSIEAAGGFLTWISNAPSAAIYISYGAPIPVSSYSLSGISPSATTDPSYNIPYQNFELTYYGNGNNSGNGDLTAINFFTAPISLSSFTNSTATGTPFDTKGFNPGVTGNTLYNQITNVSSAPGTVGSPVLTSTVNTNLVTRVLGPTQFGAQQPQANDFGTYTNFNGYFGSLSSNNTTTVFSNSSAYNTIANPGAGQTYTNANVVFVLTNQVTTNSYGYGFAATGSITVVSSTYLNGAFNRKTTNTFTDVTFSVIPGSNSANVAAAFTYYGDYSASSTNAGGGIIAMGGTGWTSFSNYITTNGFVNGGGVAAAGVVHAQIAGEISTGYDAGLAGSTNIITYNGTNVAIGSLPSAVWWGLTNPPLFSSIQTNTYYNQYANLIYLDSSNTVYGMTYGDRFTDPSASPYLSAGTNIGSWLVSIGAPVGNLGVVPEPSYTWALLLLLAGFAVYNLIGNRFFGDGGKEIRPN